MVTIDILAKICKRNPNTAHAFRLSQILTLVDNIRSKNAKIQFKNKSLLHFEFSDMLLLIKINSYDGEYYVLNSDEEFLKVFNSIHDLRVWLHQIIDGNESI